ncbi:MAG: MFS transporter [Acidobacteria bacterium]|nr:MFS transporter [Acidobacteriota bacterium]
MRFDPRILAVMLAGFTAFLSIYAPQPLLPMLARVFRTSAGEISLSITFATLGMALASPFAGALADRIGRQRLILISAFALAVFSLLSAAAPGLWPFLLTRFLIGVATPGIVAAAVAYIHEQWGASNQTGRATSFYIIGTIFGGFSGRFVAGLLAGRIDTHWVFFVVGLLNLACAVGLWICLPRETHGATAVKGASASSNDLPLRDAVAAHLRNPQLIATLAVGFCVLFTLTSTFTYINFHLAEEPFHLTSAELGWLFFVYLFGALATRIAGRGLDRRGPRRTLTIGVAAGTAGVLLTLAPSLPLVLVGLALCCSGVFTAQASTNSYLGVATSHNRALAVGLYGAAYYAGGSAGAAVPGLIWHSYGWTGCVTLIVCVQLLSIALALRLWPAQGSSDQGKGNGIGNGAPLRPNGQTPS